MLRNIVAVGVAAVALAAPCVVADDQPSLQVGMAAPKLADVTWVKGGPVSSWEPGQVYVLDFWATWCGPCKASIPHVNELYNTYKDKNVNVIGVAIWPHDGMVPTADFVQAKGSDMAYNIAADVDDKTSKAFMEASGQNGIPTVMVIDQKGTVAWIGHPTVGDELDTVLPQIVKGDFDAKKYAQDQRVREEKMNALMGDVQSSYEASDWAKMQTAAENLVAFDPKEFAKVGGMYKYIALVKQKKTGEAAAWGHQYVSTVLGTDPESLNMFAWTLVQPDGPLETSEVDAKLAVEVASAANDKLQGKDPNTLDTLARAYFVAGDYAKAVENEQKAVDLEKDAETKTTFEQSLAEYKDKAGQS